MSEKSPFLRTHLWSIVLIILVLAMGVEILFLVQENHELRSAMTARRGPFTILNPQEKVPPLVGMDQKGEEIKVEYPSAERTVLFWFSAACPSCEHNVEFWKEVYEKHGSEGYRFFGATTAGAINVSIASRIAFKESVLVLNPDPAMRSNNSRMASTLSVADEKAPSPEGAGSMSLHIRAFRYEFRLFGLAAENPVVSSGMLTVGSVTV